MPHPDSSRESQPSRFHTEILDSTLDCIIAIDARGHILEFNEMAERTFGHRRADVLGQEMAELIIPPAMRGQHREGLRRYLETGTASVIGARLELVARRVDGSDFPVELTVVPVMRDGEQCFAGHLRDISQRVRVEEVLAERMRLLALAADVGAALTEHHSLSEMLQNSAHAMVRHLDAAFARIWVHDPEDQMLVLQASAGMYTHLDGPHGRVPVGKFKIGRIAQNREPHLTNSVVGDPEVSDQEWAMREGMISFAGYPLQISDRLIGVVAMFARHEIDQTTLDAIATAAREISLGIERKQREDEVIRLYDELRKSERRKDEFLATLAHELRNPLAPILSAVEIMRRNRDGAASTPALDDPLPIIERQLQQLVRLIDDLLDVSRITRGRLELRRERVEVRDVLQAAVETSRPAIEKKHHQLEIDCADESLLLNADPTRLAQAVGNLLLNAARYTPEGGRIWLSAERGETGIAIRVRDNGVGIDPAHHDGIFEIFTQLDDTNEHGGLGIGLSLVKNLTEMHGGTVALRSEGIGRGCEFALHLPLAKTGWKAATPGKPRGVAVSKRRILVVDDNRDAADSLSILLQISGHDTYAVYDGLKAIEAIASFVPDTVLLDLGLPGLDGHEIARRIRQAPGGGDLVLIAVTGWGQRDDRRRSQAAGFDHHLVKPVAPATLAAVLNAAPTDASDVEK